MKKLIGVWLFVLLAGPAFAQTSLIGDIAAERAKYPASMTPAQVAQMLNAVAWSHRAEGWGLLRKGSGNSCPLNGTYISCDILIHAPSIQHFDVLRDAENAALPQWNNVGPCVLSDSSGCAMSNFLAPFDPGGGVTPPPVVVPPSTPSGPVYIPAPSVDLSGLMTRDAAERMFADLQNRDERTVRLLTELAEQLKKHDEHPSWAAKVFGNRYVQMILAGAGTWVGREVAK